MKSVIRKKTPVAAFLRGGLFGDRVPAETGDRRSEGGFRRFAKGVRGAIRFQASGGRLQDEKSPSSVLGRLSFAIRLRWYRLALRFKPGQMPYSSSLKSAACGLNFLPTDPTATRNTF